MVDFYTGYFMTVGIIGLIGLGICIVTISTFKLRLWKQDTYYFTTAIGLYTLHQFLAMTNLVPLYVHMVLEIGFVLLIVYGIYRMKKTAETIGA